MTGCMRNVKSRVVLKILVQLEILRTTLISNLKRFCSEIMNGLTMFWKYDVFAHFLYLILSTERKNDVTKTSHVVSSYLMAFLLSKSCARNTAIIYYVWNLD